MDGLRALEDDTNRVDAGFFFHPGWHPLMFMFSFATALTDTLSSDVVSSPLDMANEPAYQV